MKRSARLRAPGRTFPRLHGPPQPSPSHLTLWTAHFCPRTPLATTTHHAAACLSARVSLSQHTCLSQSARVSLSVSTRVSLQSARVSLSSQHACLSPVSTRLEPRSRAPGQRHIGRSGLPLELRSRASSHYVNGVWGRAPKWGTGRILRHVSSYIQLYPDIAGYIRIYHVLTAF